MRTSILLSITSLTATAALAQPAAAVDQFRAGERFTLEAGETHEGDLYFVGGEARISGRLLGDLVVWAGTVRVEGEIDGDLVAAGGQVRVEGPIADTVRAFGGTLTLSNRVEGDVLLFGGDVRIDPDAHVVGNLVVCAGRARVDATVDGDLLFRGGEIRLGGTVARNADIKADTVRLASDARIGGDLRYESRRELERAEGAVIAGNVEYEPVREDEDEGGGGFGLVFRLWQMAGSMLVGLVALALGRGAAAPLVEQIDREAVLGALVGFGTSLIVPAAAVLAIVLILTLPLGLLALVLFVIVVYLAKLPVALWIGTRGLRLIGRSAPASWAALLLGLFVLYLLFWVPYVGGLVWLATAWLGLGTLILAARARLQRRSEA